MKLELKIEASGVQIYAYEIDQEIKDLLDKNAYHGFPERGMEIVEERVSPMPICPSFIYDWNISPKTHASLILVYPFSIF